MASTKSISLSILAVGAIISLALLFTKSDTPTPQKAFVPEQGNAFIQGDKQTVAVTAKGGFTPEKTIAKSGVSTVLKITTQGTFDCSSVVSIPELNIRKNLPPTGITEIDLGVRQPGILFGTCGMGMYPFEIEFI